MCHKQQNLYAYIKPDMVYNYYYGIVIYSYLDTGFSGEESKDNFGLDIIICAKGS